MEGELAGRLLLGALATWRVTHLLAEEDGPADLVVKLRARAGDGLLGQAMDCFQCLSIWASLPIAVAVARRSREVPLTWIALSGGACLLEQATRERDRSIETRGDEDGVLWEEATGAARGQADARQPDRRPRPATAGHATSEAVPDGRHVEGGLD